MKLGTSSITLLAAPSAAPGRTIAMPQYSEPVSAAPVNRAAPVNAAPVASTATGQPGRDVAAMLERGIGALTARMGKVPLAATVVLWIAWFGLPAVQLMLPTFTLWQVVSYDPALAFSGGPGLFSLLGILALAAPALAHQVRHRGAHWLYAAPLAYLGLVGLRFLWMYVSSSGMAELAVEMLFESLDVQYGLFVVLAASLVLAARAVERHAAADLQAAVRVQERLQDLRGAALRQSERAAAAALEHGGRAASIANRELGGALSTPRGKIAIAGGLAVAVLALGAAAFVLNPKNPLERQQALMEEYAAVFEDNENDCGAMGEAISSFIEDNQSEFASLAKEVQALSHE